MKWLFSHPDFPSLASITDTFTFMGIENIACHLDRDDLAILNKPFLAVIKVNGSEVIHLALPKPNHHFQLYDGGQYSKVLSLQAFLQVWTGNILVVEKNGKSSTTYNWQSYFPLLFKLVGILFLPFILFGISLATFIFVLSLSGLWIAMALWEAESGNPKLASFCNITYKANCQAVLGSSKSKFFGKIPLSNVVFLFFFIQTAWWMLLGQHSILFVTFLLISAIPITIFTLYQQYFILKKWCPLCLLVTLNIYLQTVLMLIILQEGSISLLFDNLLQVAALTCSILLIGNAILCKIKPLLQAQLTLEQLEIESLSFRRNYHLFMPWWRQSKCIITYLPLQAKGIQAGNPNANLKLIVITNPLCEACQRSHIIWINLLNSYEQLINVEWRFYVPDGDLNDPRVKVAAWLLKTWYDNPVTGLVNLHKWYAEPEVEKFDKQQVPKADLEWGASQLTVQHQWCQTNGLSRTPILVINGIPMPIWYEVGDIEYFIEELIDETCLKENLSQPNTRAIEHGVMLADT